MLRVNQAAQDLNVSRQAGSRRWSGGRSISIIALRARRPGLHANHGCNLAATCCLAAESRFKVPGVMRLMKSRDRPIPVKVETGRRAAIQSSARKYNEGWPRSSSGFAKAAANLLAQSIVRGGATVFGDPLNEVADPRHSTVEERLVLLGISRERRLLAVMFVERTEAVRIISARPATRPERKDYEEITR